MRAFDEDNYKEAMDASFKVFAPRGISKYTTIVHGSLVRVHEHVSYHLQDSLGTDSNPIVGWSTSSSGILVSSNMEESR